jgi:hypothetical protein
VTFGSVWHWLTTSRWERQLEETVAALEEENAALRKDNRALQNSLLSGAGVTPLPEFEEVKPKPINRIRRLSLHQRQRVFQMATMPKKEGA